MITSILEYLLCIFHNKKLERKGNNKLFQPSFIILLHKNLISCAQSLFFIAVVIFLPSKSSPFLYLLMIFFYSSRNYIRPLGGHSEKSLAPIKYLFMLFAISLSMFTLYKCITNHLSLFDCGRYYTVNN